MFKKSKAVFIERMNKLQNVTIAENTVKVKIGWSDLDFELKEIPQLVSDFIQIYGMIKPQLDTLSEAEEQKKSEAGEAQPDDKPIDLSEIPF